LQNCGERWSQMKYKVQYLKPKKKGSSKHEAVFFNIEDAFFWQKMVKDNNCKNVEIVPVFNDV
jgi:hypothetical protein